MPSRNPPQPPLPRPFTPQTQRGGPSVKGSDPQSLGSLAALRIPKGCGPLAMYSYSEFLTKGTGKDIAQEPSQAEGTKSVKELWIPSSTPGQASCRASMPWTLKTKRSQRKLCFSSSFRAFCGVLFKNSSAVCHSRAACTISGDLFSTPARSLEPGHHETPHDPIIP